MFWTADWAIQALAGRKGPAETLERLIRTDGVAISWVTLGELYEGAFGTSNAQAEIAIYRQFLRPITILDLDDPTMERFAGIRSALRRQGKLIPDLDLLTAATALRHDLAMLTGDAHFQRVPGLRIYTE